MEKTESFFQKLNNAADIINGAADRGVRAAATVECNGLKLEIFRSSDGHTFYVNGSYKPEEGGARGNVRRH